jgi:hypothetical protein
MSKEIRGRVMALAVGGVTVYMLLVSAAGLFVR